MIRERGRKEYASPIESFANNLGFACNSQATGMEGFDSKRQNPSNRALRSTVLVQHSLLLVLVLVGFCLGLSEGAKSKAKAKGKKEGSSLGSSQCPTSESESFDAIMKAGSALFNRDFAAAEECELSRFARSLGHQKLFRCCKS